MLAQGLGCGETPWVPEMIPWLALTSQAPVLVFISRWGKEHTKGRLLAPKLDFVQRVLAKGMLR